MSALPIVNVLSELQEAGVTVTLRPKGLWASPAGAMTPKVRDLIGQHKNALIFFLSTEAANDGSIAVNAAALSHVQNRAQLASESYLGHHWSCPQCWAGGQGRGQRCEVGAALWDQFEGVLQ